MTKEKPKVAVPTPGPNDPCPCKSGKKWKKCCRDKAWHAAREEEAKAKAAWDALSDFERRQLEQRRHERAMDALGPLFAMAATAGAMGSPLMPVPQAAPRSDYPKRRKKR